jgi:hypothetical protein
MVANEEGIAAQVIQHCPSTIWRWWLVHARGLACSGGNIFLPRVPKMVTELRKQSGSFDSLQA